MHICTQSQLPAPLWTTIDGRIYPCCVSSILPRRRRRNGALAVALALALGAFAARPLLARSVRARIEAEATRRGLVARIETVRVGPWPPLRLTGVALEKPGRWRVTADTVDARWTRRTRIVVGHAVFDRPARLTVAAAPTDLDVARRPHDALRVAPA